MVNKFLFNNKRKSILLIGGGGHCQSVLDSIFSLRVYHKIGIIDSKNSSVSGISVVGTDDDLPLLKKEGWDEAFITVGSVDNTRTRRKLYNLVKKLNFHLPSIVDPSAIIARKVQIGEGSYLGKHTVVNAGTRIGCCAIINTGAIVEHDCIVGDFTHISPGTVLCGQVFVGNDSHIGAGSVVKQQISIGEQSLIGAGSVVVQNILKNEKAYGNPCRVVK